MDNYESILNLETNGVILIEKKKINKCNSILKTIKFNNTNYYVLGTIKIDKDFYYVLKDIDLHFFILSIKSDFKDIEILNLIYNNYIIYKDLEYKCIDELILKIESEKQ